VGGGGGNLREVVGACGGIVVALYCSGVYFVLAFPFFTYVPSSGALGARMLPKARLIHAHEVILPLQAILNKQAF